MELSDKEIKLLLSVISQCSYNFETSKIVVPLSERLNLVLVGKQAEVNKDNKSDGQ